MADGSVKIVLDIASIAPLDSLTAGWRYLATLHLGTPLAYLEMDGQFSPGPTQPALVGPADSYLPNGEGFNRFGIWVRVIDYDSLGFSPPAPGSRATWMGPVATGSREEQELLSFLKSFRYIVETADGIDQMLLELADLSESTPGNREIWNRLRKLDHLFPDSFFFGQLERLPGVGASMAHKLYMAGFRTVDEVHAASDPELLAIPGFGKGLLSKIRIS
jgi:hypothetical protein